MCKRILLAGFNQKPLVICLHRRFGFIQSVEILNISTSEVLSETAFIKLNYPCIFGYQGELHTQLITLYCKHGQKQNDTQHQPWQ